MRLGALIRRGRRCCCAIDQFHRQTFNAASSIIFPFVISKRAWWRNEITASTKNIFHCVVSKWPPDRTYRVCSTTYEYIRYHGVGRRWTLNCWKPHTRRQPRESECEVWRPRRWAQLPSTKYLKNRELRRPYAILCTVHRYLQYVL